MGVVGMKSIKENNSVLTDEESNTEKIEPEKKKIRTLASWNEKSL